MQIKHNLRNLSMKIKGSVLAFFFFLISLSSFAENQPEQAKGNDSLELSGKQWKLDFKDQNPQTTIREYITNNETVNHWSELFTIQQFKLTFPKQVTPETFADKEMVSLTRKGYPCTYIKHENTPQEIIIEFKANQPNGEQQDEIQRIVRMSNDQFVTIHYTIRKSDMGDAERAKWIEAIKKVDIASIQ